MESKTLEKLLEEQESARLKLMSLNAEVNKRKSLNDLPSIRSKYEGKFFVLGYDHSDSKKFYHITECLPDAKFQYSSFVLTDSDDYRSFELEDNIVRGISHADMLVEVPKSEFISSLALFLERISSKLTNISNNANV